MTELEQIKDLKKDVSGLKRQLTIARRMVTDSNTQLLEVKEAETDIKELELIIDKQVGLLEINEKRIQELADINETLNQSLLQSEQLQDTLREINAGLAKENLDLLDFKNRIFITGESERKEFNDLKLEKSISVAHANFLERKIHNKNQVIYSLVTVLSLALIAFLSFKFHLA